MGVAHMRVHRGQRALGKVGPIPIPHTPFYHVYIHYVLSFVEIFFLLQAAVLRSSSRKKKCCIAVCVLVAVAIPLIILAILVPILLHFLSSSS